MGTPSGSATRLADVAALAHPDDRALVGHIDDAEIARLIDQDERYAIDFRVVRPDGTIQPVQSVACIVRDRVTGHRRAVGCIRAVTTAAHAVASEESAIDADLLSERERECLRWVGAGKTAWEIAAILGRSPRTIEFHLANATRKLGASNRIHAAVVAVRRGLL